MADVNSNTVAEATKVNNVKEHKRITELSEKELAKLDKIYVKLCFVETKTKKIFPECKVAFHQKKLLVSPNGKNKVEDSQIRLAMIKNNHAKSELDPCYVNAPTRLYKGKHEHEDGGTTEYIRFECLVAENNVVRGFITKYDFDMYKELNLPYTLLKENKTVDDEDFVAF